MALIKITKGKEVIVDDWLYDELNQYRWCAQGRAGSCYAVRRARDETRQLIFMHHQVLGIIPGTLRNLGMHTDHINGNTFDNRKANLRLVTAAENAQNSDKVRMQKGIGLDRTHGTYKAYINFPNKRRLNVGTYKTYEEAFKARQLKLRELGIPQC